MRRLTVFAILLCLFSIQAGAVELVLNGEFDDFSGIPWSSWTGGLYFYDDAGDSICSYGWWDGSSIYQDTQQRILPNAPYVMQIRVRGAEGGYDEWGEGVRLQLQGIDTSATWALAGESLEMFPTTDFQHGLVAPWREYEFVFNFTDAPTFVGQKLAVALVQIDSSDPPYDNYGIYGWIHTDYIRLKALAADDPTPVTDWELDDNQNAAGTPNGATVDVQLEWYTARDIDPNSNYSIPNPNVTDHYLYIKEDTTIDLSDPNYVPDFTGVSPIPISAGAPVNDTASYPVTGLNYDSTYIWRVDESISGSATTDPNTITGPVWFFETISKNPVITDEPNDILITENTDAVFELTATSATSETYQWYESADAIPDPDGADPNIPGATSNTLILTNVPLSKAGTYVFCVISNDSPVDTTSRMALLEVKRQMAHWKLDGNLFDTGVNAYGYHGSMSGTASYKTGIDNQALELFNDADHLQILGSISDFNNYHLGLTASAWVNTTNVGWGGIIAKQNRDGSPWTGWVLVTQNAGIPTLNIRNVGSVTGMTNVADGQWHLVTATFDGADARIYVDGILENQADLSGIIETDNPLYEGYPLDDRPVTIGAEDTNGLTPFVGLIDDVQYFNYAISATKVVDMYNALVDPDINPCIEELYPSSADLSGPAGEPDCVIDLYDFVEIAAGWLDTGCYPNPCP